MNTIVTDIQRFSIHDGPGIRTVVFFKGCNLYCPWCQNPEAIKTNPEIAFYEKKCIESWDCLKVCPENAILKSGSDRINRSLCTECGICIDHCSSGALKIIGKEYDLETLLAEILQDADYYENSGGGVTVSGGEATLHADFLIEFLTACKKHQLHTNIETNGYFSQKKMELLLPLLDLIFFDIKIIDTAKHKQILSKDNKRIFENMRWLLDRCAPVEFRLPLIPDYTTTDENLTAICKLLIENKIPSIHLLPYHSMGEGKLKHIESDLTPLNLKPFTQEQLDEIVRQFEQSNIQTTLYR
ncbi:MAG: glycyl-radical enzyme activating protein [Bacteroidetes bacterium]|nr:glycyl-radical enzyme activating protein [Bacteroidota bacterium]